MDDEGIYQYKIVHRKGTQGAWMDDVPAGESVELVCDAIKQMYMARTAAQERSRLKKSTT